MDVAGNRLALAEHYLQIAQPQRALETLNGLPAESIADWYAFFLRGCALLELERYAEVQQSVDAGLRINPDSVPLLYLRCNCLAAQGDLAGAETAILAALRLDPELPPLLCRYAYLVAQAGQLPKAERLVAVAARVDPDDTTVARTRMLLAYLRGDDATAARQGAALLGDGAEDVWAHGMLGVAMAARGDAGQAARHFRAAVRLNPADPELAESARLSRAAAHPLLWPMRIVYRWGPGVVWLVVMSCFLMLATLRLYPAAVIFAGLYVVFCVYSWVMPPVVRWWASRRSR